MFENEEMFYTVEGVEEAISVIINAQDSIKYLLNCPQSMPDAKLLTPDLLEAYESLADYCGELKKSFDYYIKAENWKCADPEAMAAHVTQYNNQNKK